LDVHLCDDVRAYDLFEVGHEDGEVIGFVAPAQGPALARGPLRRCFP